MPMPQISKKGLPITFAKILIMPSVLFFNLDNCLKVMLGTVGSSDIITGLESKYYPYSDDEIKERISILVNTMYLMKKEYKFYDIIVEDDKANFYDAISKKDSEYLTEIIFNNVINVQVFCLLS